jgi:hypothetical protein
MWVSIYGLTRISLLTEIPADYEATLHKLANADGQIESLKEQLDAALGAEDILERLTERNLTMQEVHAPDDYHTRADFLYRK